ncbi:MAG TPA: sigma-54 dependent transcriptional regulator [Kiritimatiellia bacterium]|nr:sigma-54 dependent transcriptional regulator [Kiritimatiellia bacterium]HRZ12726.1 sigma-54 dependent transcriptional regulator [Kiritimatiellia bacterium]HSA18322.1 sigma-54 dependent transcriptional regulator [Kiritimatiellia bacterium]
MGKESILLVDDSETTRKVFTANLSRQGYEIQGAASLAEARDAVNRNVFDGILLDLELPDGNGLDWLPELRESHPNAAIVIITGTGDIPSAVKAMQYGADHFLAKPVNMDELIVFLRKGREFAELRRRNQFFSGVDRKRSVFYFGTNPAIGKMLELAETAARNDSSILLFGETGSGKGVLARWIHAHSARADKPFVDINCSSLKGDLLASEIFGHARGAFTSAVESKQGLLEAADGSTLFLDEIGDMDPGVQASFLKVIEERQFRRVGEVKVRRSEFRLICATNHDLQEQCAQGRFRNDLYFRINVFPIEVPPLRELREDIPGLIRHLLREMAGRDLELAEEVMPLLTGYDWPGNIRELRNVLERAWLLAGGRALRAEHFPGLSAPRTPVGGTLDLNRLEEQKIREALRRYGGDVERAAKALGLSRATLYRRIKPMESPE